MKLVPAFPFPFAFALLAILATLAAPRNATAAPPPLIPRSQFFRAPEHSTPLVSPDGAHLAWISPTNGIPNLWVRPLATGTNTSTKTNTTTTAPRLLSLDPRGSIRQPAWQPDSQAVLYLQDPDGSGTFHLMQAHVPSGNIRDLTPFTGVQARLVTTSTRFTDEILVAMNLRNRRLFDVYRVDLRTGSITPDAENTGEVSQWFADNDLNLRLAQVILPNGEFALGTRTDPRSLWRPLLRWGNDDTLGKFFGFGPGNSNLFLVSSVRAQAPRLLSIDATTGAATALAQDVRFDVSAALFHPRSNALEAVQFNRARAQWQLANTNLLPDFEVLRRHRNADIDILSRDLADRTWTVSFTSADAPIQFALYDRSRRAVTPLFAERSELPSSGLGSTRSVSFSARDGLSIEGYLTLPPGIEPRRLPAVVLVHAGPWSRVVWSFDPEVHWLANRGYAVLQVNFRGSEGYGKDHRQAGNQEWGGKILLDLLDARKWTGDQGFIDPKRTAIMGTGFGGYAALAVLARHPDEFAVGIAINGTPNLATMIQSIPAAATGIRALLDQRVGRLDADAALLRDHSPMHRAAFIKGPLLIAATAHDPQAPAAEMDAFVAAIRREGRAIDYLLFGDEGSAIRNPANQLRLYAAIEAFLARHLQGRAELPAASEQFEALKR